MIYEIEGFTKLYEKSTYYISFVDAWKPLINTFYQSYLATVLLSKSRLSFMNTFVLIEVTY